MPNTILKRYLPYLLFVLVLGILIKLSLQNGDFNLFLEAAKRVAAKKNPYHEWLSIVKDNYGYYFYSPLWATLLIPFSYLPNVIPNFIWLLANTWFLYRTWILLTKFIDLLNLSGKQFRWLLFLSILLSVRYIVYNFELIQMTVFLLWGALESLDLFRNRKFLLGGALLAFIINIKILPLVLIPYLIYRKEFRGALSTLFFSVIYLFLPGLFLGWSNNLFLLSEWWSVINPGNAEHLLEMDLGIHSLTALIPTLLMKTGGILPYSRNILNLDIETTTFILNAVRTGLVLFTLYFLRWPPFKQAKSRLNEIHELSYIFLLVPLIFPHQQKYAFFLALPAFFYISYFIINNFQARTRMMNKTTSSIIIILFILSFALMTLSTDGVIGRNLNQVTQYYKTITYGAMILIILLIICTPERIEKCKVNR